MRKMVKNVSTAVLGGLLGLGISGGSAIAGEFTADECLMHSKGGLHVKYAKDPSYWLAVAGIAGFDTTSYMGGYRDKALDPASLGHRAFPSSAHVRGIIFGVAGGLGPNWSYVMGFKAAGERVLFDDAYLTYLGLCEGLRLSVGNVPGQFFGFDSSNSFSWIPFLERNLASNAFQPDEGLGVMAQYGWCDGSLVMTAFQPTQYESVFNAHVLGNGLIEHSTSLAIKRDYWTTTGRLTFSPLHTDCDVYHFGVSAMWQEQPTAIRGIPVYGKRFAVYPGSRGRSTHHGLGNTTARLVDTGHIRANYIRQFNIEAARQWGPVIIDGEYTDTYVHRVGDPQGALSFSGWNIQGRYMLTGESHSYDVDSGNFCSFTPNNIFGAVELAARYDFVNLNSKNLLGGTEHNVTVGVNWYINDNVRLSLNYIRADIHPGTAAALAVGAVPNTLKRNLDIVAFRAGFRF